MGCTLQKEKWNPWVEGASSKAYQRMRVAVRMRMRCDSDQHVVDKLFHV
jgi:hypothetical protein